MGYHTNRSRVSNQLTPAIPVKGDHTWASGTKEPTTTVWSGQAGGISKTMADCVNPGWRERQRRGEIVMSDMVITKSEISSPTNQTFQIGPHTPTNWGTHYYKGDLAGLVASTTALEPVVNISDSAGNAALTEAYVKVNSAKVLAGEPLSDLGRTLMMLRNPFQGSRDLLTRMIKSRNRNLGKTAESAAKASANAWLEYRYGWKPLFLDADATIQLVRDKRAKLIKKQRLVARSTKDSSYEITRNFSTGFLGGTATGTYTRKITRRASAGIIYERRAQTMSESYASDFGLNARNLPVLLWEKIPYSFVVDWFVGVGDFIQAVIPNPDVNILGSWLTYVDEYETIFSPASISNTVSYAGTTRTYYGSCSGSTRKETTINRNVHIGLPTLPVVKTNPFTLLHTTDALALTIGSITDMLRVMRH